MERQGGKKLRKKKPVFRKEGDKQAGIGENGGVGMGCTLNWKVSLRKQV